MPMLKCQCGDSEMMFTKLKSGRYMGPCCESKGLSRQNTPEENAEILVDLSMKEGATVEVEAAPESKSMLAQAFQATKEFLYTDEPQPAKGEAILVEGADVKPAAEVIVKSDPKPAKKAPKKKAPKKAKKAPKKK